MRKQISDFIIYCEIIACFYLLTNRKCYGQLPCRDNCTVSHKWQNCYCDNCDLFDDCCANKGGLLNPDKAYKYTCNIQLPNKDFIYSISKCDKNWKSGEDNEIKSKCEEEYKNGQSIANQAPVFSNKTNSTYRNIFCAMCNFENIDSIKFFKLIAQTIEQKTIPKEEYIRQSCFQQNRSQCCGIYYSMDEVKYLRKCTKAISTCLPGTPKELVDKCNNFTAYRYFNYTTYKNEYCAKCNNVSQSNIKCTKQTDARSGPTMHNMELLFKLNSFTNEVYIISDKTENQTCNSHDRTFCSLKIRNYNKSNDIIIDSMELSMFEIIKSYLTVIGQTTSIVCLIILLMVYLKFKHLRNKPGKILMSLSVALIHAQLFFLLSGFLPLSVKIFKLFGQFSLCYLLGLLVHYFYLAYFMWSNVISFDLFMLFNGLSVCRTKQVAEMGKTFLKYSIYAWTAPLVLVLSLILLQSIRGRLPYEETNCFINESFNLIIFFILPVTFIVLSNIMFFIKTILSIKCVDKSTNRYLRNNSSTFNTGRNSSPSNSILVDRKTKSTDVEGDKSKSSIFKMESIERKRVILFMKLFVIMGISWVLGLVNAFSNNLIISYAYIIVNSLQGLFILIAFVLNRQTLKEIKTLSTSRRT